MTVNKDINYLTVENVIHLHDMCISREGGKAGIKELGYLESAVMQPKQSAFDQELHPTIEAKAAAYMFHLSQNHPFPDGNKRTALVATQTFLDINGKDLNLTNERAVQLVTQVAAGEISKEQLAKELEKHIQEKQKEKSQEMTCVVEDASETTMFRRAELSELIKYEEVMHVNGQIFEAGKKETLQIAYEKDALGNEEKETARRFAVYNDRSEKRYIEITGLKRSENIKGLELSEEHSRKVDQLKPDEIWKVSIKEIRESITREQTEQQQREQHPERTR